MSEHTDPVFPWVVGGSFLAIALWFLSRPSKHFAWSELTTTSTGLDNTPDIQARIRLILLARQILEPLRNQFGPIFVSSAYRSKAVNDAVGGATNSFHLKGSGVDLYANSATNEEMAEWLYLQTHLPLAEVVIEDHTGHLHISRDAGGAPGAREFLRYDGSNYTTWEP